MSTGCQKDRKTDRQTDRQTVQSQLGRNLLFSPGWEKPLFSPDWGETFCSVPFLTNNYFLLQNGFLYKSFQLVNKILNILYKQMVSLQNEMMGM